MSFEQHIAVIARNSDMSAPAGAGVCLGTTLLTCAHVVNVALGRDIDDRIRPEGTVFLRFPSLLNEVFHAQIADGADSWSPPPASSRSGGDLCLLHISEPCSVKPAELWNLEALIGREFRTGGFPPEWRGDLDVARGEIVGADGPLYMLRPTAIALSVLALARSRILGGNKRPAGLIHPGFSGAPVESDGKIIGLIAEARVLSSDATAYMIPVSSFPSSIRTYLESDFVREETKISNAPPAPTLFVGRENTLQDIKTQLGIHRTDTALGAHVITAVHGWPGVGKTSIAAALANDIEVTKSFPDGILWAALGEKPHLIAVIAGWARRLGQDDLLKLRSLREATECLISLFAKRRLLLIVDDVWETSHAEPFRQARGPLCTLIFTTRLSSVADDLAPVPDAVIRIPVLTEEASIKLFAALAPRVAEMYPDTVRDLVRDLECLPLALQVAGHLANAEWRKGWDVSSLLAELRDGSKILRETAPADRMDFETQTIPTVATLLKQSVNRLSPDARDCFAFLGAFAPKPATLDVQAMGSVWDMNDPRPMIDTLVDRGLLEPIGVGRFQMHALMVALAKSLLSPD
jgi:hypothetical protein